MTQSKIDLNLLFAEQGKLVGPVGGPSVVDGMAKWTTAVNNKSPIGEWTLAFKDEEEVRDFFANDQIEDILFVITFGGRTPEWPQ